MVVLENDELTVAIKLRGAELCSVKDRSDRHEYIWQADPSYWSRHAPVLFPIVGRLKDDGYIYEDSEYAMGQHGFARDSTFDVISQTDQKVIMRLKSDSDHYSIYPFSFVLDIEFRLHLRTLHIGYRVYNGDDKTMYYSIGGHPAFRCPLESGQKRSDYLLRFDTSEKLVTQRLKDGLRTGEEESLAENATQLNLVDHLFDRDALIFSGLRSTTVSLQTKDKTYLTFDFQGFPYLGIWSKSRNSTFICIEPWIGVADTITHTRRLVEKEGISALPSGQEHHYSYHFTIH